MGVDFRLGADVGSFNMSINQAKTVLKGLNTEMKAAEAEYKATGDAEKLMSDKTKTLTSQLNIQKSIVDKTQKALEDMIKEGVTPADDAYQALYKQLMTAQTGMYQAQAALNNLGTSAQEAATGANQLETGLQGISKKISLDQVISGIDRITSGLETAAKKAVSLGQDLWNALLTQARLADDTATQALMWEMPLEEYKKRLAFHKSGIDTSLEAILTAESKMKKGIGKSGLDDELAALGIRVRETFLTDAEIPELESRVRDYSEVMWEAGQAILALGDDADKETKAQALFGKSWRDLMDVFTRYKTLEEYNAAWQEMNVASDEATENNAALSDSVATLETSLGELQQEVSGALAPGLTAVADSLNGLLQEVLAFLQTEKGQEMLDSMTAAVTELFAGLEDISAEDVVAGFKSAFDAVLGCLDWIVQNKNGIVTALEAIGVAFATMKIGQFALNLGKVVTGFSNLPGGTPGKEAATGNQTAVTTGGDKFSILDKAVTGMGTKFILDYTWDVFTAGVQAEANHEGREGFTRRVFANNAQYGMYSQEEAERRAEEALRFYEGFDEYLATHLDSGGGGASRSFELPVEPVAEEDSAAKLAEEIGVVHVPISLVWDRTIGGAGGGKDWNTNLKYANGIDFVPNTRLAWLHPGERVMTAQANKHYTYHSNNYFGNVNLNNGLQIEQLTESIDRQNRKTMKGYGS